ncbi:MAG: hypothetical protein AAF664_12495 [Planctomycetota bacterium]
MHETKYTTIQSFDHRSRADMLLMLLDQNEIPARLADEHVIAMEWALSAALGGIKVQVPTDYETRALEIAKQLQASTRASSDSPKSETESDSCLSCGIAMPEDLMVCSHCGWTYA